MKSTKIIGIILILASLFLGYISFNKIAANTKEINIIGIKIDASDDEGQTLGYAYLGVSILLFAGGIYIVGKSK